MALLQLTERFEPVRHQERITLQDQPIAVDYYVILAIPLNRSHIPQIHIQCSSWSFKVNVQTPLLL